MKTIRIPLAGAACVAMATWAAWCMDAQAQERMAIGSRDGFVVQQCVPAMRAMQGERFARAACECAWRNLREHDEVSFGQFEAANRLCMLEHEYDPVAFMSKYLSRAD